MIRVVPTIFLNVVLPFCLFFAFILRPSLLSAFYGILLFIWPFIPGVNGNVPDFTKRYLIITVIVTSAGLLAQCVFGIILAASPNSEIYATDCSDLSSILRVIGLQRLNLPNVGHAIRLIAPDIAACVSSVATLIVFVLYSSRPPSCVAPEQRGGQPNELPVHRQSSAASREQQPASSPSSPVEPNGGTINNNGKDELTTRPFMAQLLIVCLVRLSEALVVVLLCAAAVIYPSILSSVYFVAFLLIMTWWSLYKPLSMGAFSLVKLSLAAYSAFHLLILYLYQTREFQMALPSDSLGARLFGLTVIVNASCVEFWKLHLVPGQQWTVYANPCVIFGFYIYVALQTVSTYRLLANESEEDGGESVPTNTRPHSRRTNTTPAIGLTTLANGKRAGTNRGSLGRDYTRLFSIGTVPVEQTENKTVGAAMAFIIRHSYALALVMMMAWAITYHSWLAFIWLALACIIWMMADSRRACFLFSPFIVFYAEALLCLQFIYGLNLTKSELPDDVSGVPLRQIGLMKPKGAACIPLFVRAFFSIPFWITLRLYLRERHYEREIGENAAESRTSESHQPSMRHSILAPGPVGFMLAKYWIYMVGLVLLLISIRTPVVAYEVCYMAFFVVLITVLQISFGMWRLMLFFYWMVLTAFSIGVLLLVYTYQFSEVPMWWSNWTRWPSDAFHDLGLVSYEPGDLFVQLLTPISFLIVVILQMKFFHTSFMRLTQFSGRGPKGNLETKISVDGSTWFSTFKTYYEIACNIMWRLAEIHFTKVVAFAMIMLAVSEVCAVNFVFTVIVGVMVPWRRSSTVVSVIATIWAALVLLSKMIFQMHFVDISVLNFYKKNCTSFEFIEDPATWAGFAQLGPMAKLSGYVRGYLILLVLLTIQAIIKIRQKYCREVLGQQTPARGVLFPGIGRQDADENFTKCLMFLSNYGFYKFGLEITYIFIVIDVGVRMDAVAFVYTVWMLVMLAMPRRTLARFWWLFVVYLAISLPVQYAVCVGLPPSSCLQYPWYNTDKKLTYWLYLPNYNAKPNQYFLVADFFVFLAASCQLYVFRMESSPTTSAPCEGGDNAPIWHYNPLLRLDLNNENGQQHQMEASIENPTPNFVTCTKSYLDVVKIFLFVYFHWITLFIIFAAGVGGISGFAFGYLVAAFALLWKGNDLYLEAHSRVMIRWYILLFYNVFAIMLKISLQVVGCVYICSVCSSSTSWVIQLFSIACLRGHDAHCNSAEFEKSCTVSKSEAEILYDGICFAFLIFQIRIFSSWYFRHSIAEFRAERILSARGAYLINQLIRKDMHEQKQKEDRILRKVKAKTERIRRHYLKQMEGKKHFEPNTYAETKRGGDYYMFDYDSDDDEPEELEEKEPIAPETATSAGGLGPTQLLHIAGQKSFDINEIVSEAEKREAVIKRELSAGLSSSTSATSAFEIDPTDVHMSMAPIRETSEQESPNDEPKEAEKASGGACVNSFKFIGMLLGSVLNSLALTFNRWSRDYRYVAFVLKGEKRRLKETLMKQLEYESDFRRVRETVFNQEMSKKIHYVQSMRDIETAEREAQEHALEHNVLSRFLISTYYLFVSHTELMCYLMMILDHMGNAAIISLPLPFLAFFWGTLCSPRPPKFFWVTVITYTEAMIVVKFMFQFKFWPSGDVQSNEPFHVPRILGIEQSNYYAAYDVALLMCLFFHRYVLKSLGLWKDAHNDMDVNEIDAGVFERRPTTDSGQDRVDRTSETQSVVEDGELSIAEGLTAPGRRKSAATQGRLAYCSSFVQFYRRLLNPPFRYVMDLYSFMFLCDLICFLILAFGYSKFGEIQVQGRSYDVVYEIQQNKVPLPFVTMLIMLMFLIIVDRAIYLSKSVVGKLVFQYLLVTIVHGWIFFGLPAMTNGPIGSNSVAQLWYFVKCVYFLLSAWQIRNSYPSRIQGNLLAKKFGLTNYCLFTGFMAAPFLFELRTLIDWIWTETSMPLFDYFTMENIYARVFQSKCMRQYEMEYPVPRGEAKPKWIKYGTGLPILILIVVLLWLPLLLFALVNAIGNRVSPDQAQFSVSVEGYSPLYVMEAQKVNLHAIDAVEYEALYDRSRFNKQGTAFLRQYWQGDIYIARFRSGSISEWIISPAGRHALMHELKNSTNGVVINFNWQFRRPSQTQRQLPQLHTSFSSVDLKKDPDGARIRQELINALEGKSHDGVYVKRAFPPFMVIPSIGLVQPARAVLYNTSAPKSDNETYADVRLHLTTVQPDYPNSSAVQYWSLRMVEPSKPEADVEVTVFVDRVFPTYLDAFTSGGIIGVYVVVVLAAGRFIRTLVVQSPLDVILNEMPNVDRVLQLCLDVFLVREAGDFLLEQDLFAKLIFLFRSPETLVRWTRPKVE